MLNLENLIFLLKTLRYIFELNKFSAITWLLILNLLFALRWDVLSKSNLHRKDLLVGLVSLIYPLMNLFSGSFMTQVLFDKNSVWPSVIFLYNFGVHILISVYLIKYYKGKTWFALSLILLSTWIGLCINFIVSFMLGVG
jgi:hypothetical protein